MKRVLSLRQALWSTCQQGLPVLGGVALLGALSACGGGGTETGATSASTTTALASNSTSVSAVNSGEDAGATDTSITVSANTNLIPLLTPVPTGLSASLDRATNSIHLTWTAAADPATAYRVYWAQDALPDSNAAYTEVYTTTYTQPNLVEGSTYTFRLSAWLNGVESARSTATSVLNTDSPTPGKPNSDTGL